MKTWRTMLGAGIACCALAGGPALAGQTLATQLPEPVAQGKAAAAGTLDANRLLDLDLSLPLRNQASLRRLLAGITTPGSPQFRHYLSAAEFTDRFGPLQADHDKVVAFLTAQGLTVTQVSPTRQLISVTGRVADVERVFHVHMGLYQHPQEARLFFAPDRVPSLDLDVPVNQVLGLDDYELPYRKLIHGAAPAGHARGTAPGGQLDGNDIRAAYYPSGSLTGKGQSIGLMELAGLNVSDVALFFSNGYGPANSVPIKLIRAGGRPVTCDSSCGDDGEQALDVEYAISMAPGLKSVRVYVGSTAERVLSRQASDNISKILSTSWGFSHRNAATDEQFFAEFEAQGQTNLSASGDYSTLQASGPWPEESANITAVGGTDLTVTNGAWAGETGWNGSASGPSKDHTIAAPKYQIPFVTAANGGSKKYRNVSDIAASADTDMYLCANGGCGGGNGGTSFASPIWAGFIALVNQYAAEHGGSEVGFINPVLYQTLGHATNYSQIFHDVLTGQSGTFMCTPSWDLVTGFGSPAGQPLVAAFTP